MRSCFPRVTGPNVAGYNVELKGVPDKKVN